MNITKEFLLETANAAVNRQTERPDVLWAVTNFRIEVFCLFKAMGLSTPTSRYPGAAAIADNVRAVMSAYAEVLSTFPETIKYSDERMEMPRSNSADRALEVFNGLQSDSDAWGSAQELVRLVATNADSDHQKLDYTVLMGIVLRIISLVGDVEVMDVCADLIK